MQLPAIAGAAQVVQRPDSGPLREKAGPIELMVEASLLAASDAGAPGLLAQVGWVGVAGGWFSYSDPGRLIAEGIGAPQARTALTSISGTAPQELLAAAAERISRGELDVALVVGGEARWSHQKLKAAHEEPAWLLDPGRGEDPEVFPGFPQEVMEEARTFGAAATAYALFEDSLRSSLGRTVDEQRDAAAELWSRFSEVATQNPYAWDRSAHSPSEIRTPGDRNRMITFPYTKAMVANNTVDMASALLVCSRDTARAAGVPQERLVFPHVVAGSHETWRVVNRSPLHGSPALAAAGRVAYDAVSVGPEDIAHVDLYACFPSIVQMSSAALGFDGDRPLTVTGGLGMAGAAVGNATGQSLAAMVHKVREGGLGLVHGNGGNATKHSVGIYSTEPPAAFERHRCDDIDRGSVEQLPAAWTGPVTVEAATVLYDRSGPTYVLAAVLDSTGRRAFARCTDEQLVAAVQFEGIAGLPATLTEAGNLKV